MKKKKLRGDEMSCNQDVSSADMAEHERTYRGFLLALKLSAAVTVATLLLMYFFLVR
jgi:hypothetical protein